MTSSASLAVCPLAATGEERLLADLKAAPSHEVQTDQKVCTKVEHTLSIPAVGQGQCSCFGAAGVKHDGWSQLLWFKVSDSTASVQWAQLNCCHTNRFHDDQRERFFTVVGEQGRRF